MKNLEIYLDDNTKIYEAIISNHIGILKEHHNILMPSLKDLVQSVINGEYKIEFKNHILDTSTKPSIFEKIELFQQNENFKIVFDTLTPNKILEYFYKDEIPYDKKLSDLENLSKFFNIDIQKDNTIKGIGEALLKANKYIIKYKTQTYQTREKFTITHELGHIFLHFSTNKISEFIDYDDELTPKAARGIYNNKYETEADDFAMELLVPKFQLLALIKECKYMSELKYYFNVSNGTIFYALRKHNLLNKIIDDLRYW